MKAALLTVLMAFFSLNVSLPQQIAENGTEKTVDKLHERMKETSLPS
ncbi:hypothetical protein [Pseudomonas aeruginosa]